MLYQSPAGSILSVVVHSLLIMPPDIIKPLLPSFHALLPSIEKLNQVLPAAALLEEQELEWPVKGKKKLIIVTMIILIMMMMMMIIILTIVIVMLTGVITIIVIINGIVVHPEVPTQKERL